MTVFYVFLGFLFKRFVQISEIRVRLIRENIKLYIQTRIQRLNGSSTGYLILTFPWGRKISPVGAQIFPDGDAVTTPIMHLADFLTESFLSCIKDKQENGAMT